MIKTVNFIRILSILLFLVAFVFIYAFMPVMVNLLPDSDLLIHREEFFYYGISAFFVINVLSWILVKTFTPMIYLQKGEETAAWFSAISVVINVCLCMIGGFLAVLNTDGRIPLSNYSYLNYLIVILIIVWVVGFSFLYTRKKGTPSDSDN